MLGEIQIQRVGVETVESAAAEWSTMTSVNKANNVLTAPTAIFKWVQRYGPIQQRQTSLSSPNG
jgi:hypothetical protein